MSLNVANELLSLSTPAISDAMDMLGLAGACINLHPVMMGLKMSGPAYTVRYIPIGPEKQGAHDFLDDVPPGSVVVIDNGGRIYCTVWGDLMTRVAKLKGLAGTVIDGVCRDIDSIRELSYPVFSRGTFMVTGKGRMQPAGTQEMVNICDVIVQPGDLIAGDDSGVLVIPQKRASEVLQLAQDIAEREARIRKYIEQGMNLKEARSREGYHQIAKK